MNNFNLQKLLKGKRAALLNMGFSKATVGRLLYTAEWMPMSSNLLKLRELVDIPFAITGAELAARMKRLNLSIAHLHRLSGVSRGMISSYIRGKSELRMDTLRRIIDALPSNPLPSRLKISEEEKLHILRSVEPLAVLAARYSIDPSYISHLRARAKKKS